MKITREIIVLLTGAALLVALLVAVSLWNIPQIEAGIRSFDLPTAHKAGNATSV
jgi:CHASE3 domain sensor protein